MKEALKNFKFPLLLSIIDKGKDFRNLSKGKVIVNNLREVIKGFSANSFTPENIQKNDNKDLKTVVMLNAQDL